MAWLVLTAVVVLVVGFVVAAYVRRWRWAGFAGAPEPESGQPGKTLWDWLQLLVIPLGLAAVAFALNLAQSNREQQREDRRAQLDRQIADERRREDALTAYLGQMSDLMLERNLLLSQPLSIARQVARTLTLTVLPRLDGQRKGTVLRFLNEAALIEQSPLNDIAVSTIVRLEGAELRGAVVRSNLFGADLSGTDLRGANFHDAELHDVRLRDADLRGATFTRALLDRIDFTQARLENTDFRGAGITRTNFDSADLTGADFTSAKVFANDFDAACVTRTRFRRAELSGSSLRLAVGHDVDLSGAYILRMRLGPTNITGLKLTGAHFGPDGRLPDGGTPGSALHCAPHDLPVSPPGGGVG